MIHAYLASIFRGIESLAFDASCIICGVKESRFCGDCRRSWLSDPKALSGEAFPVYSSIIYGETAATIVLLAKESGISLAKYLVAQELKASIRKLYNAELKSEARVILVPIPSSRRAKMRRGSDFVSDLSKVIARELNHESLGAHFLTRSILTISRKVKDQSGLSEVERYRNLNGVFEVSSNFKSESPVIVIDDVITTGSTLREAVRALKERNLTVSGVATACASRRRLPIR